MRNVNLNALNENNKKFIENVRGLPKPPKMTTQGKALQFINEQCQQIRSTSPNKIFRIKELREFINIQSIYALTRKKISSKVQKRISNIMNLRDPVRIATCLIYLISPPVPTGGRKKRRTKRKTKRKSKARMTKQKRKINGVTRNVRISTTGRKYILLNGKRHFL